MDKEIFWKMIERAREAVGIDDTAPTLSQELSAMDVPEIAVFHNILQEYMKLSYQNKLWAAAYVINGGCSDDGFDYFRGWLIAMGKTVYMGALENPESLGGLELEQEDASYEDMLAVAYEAFFKKIGSGRDYDAFQAEMEKYALSEADREAIAGEINYADDINADWDEGSLEEIVPELCEAFEW